MPPQRSKLAFSVNVCATFLVTFALVWLFGTPLSAVELPAELPLWKDQVPEYSFRLKAEERVRFHKPQPGSLTGLNRVFSNVSVPTYSLHRPKKPHGIGLVICPGGGFREVWIDREGHELAIRLKDYGITSLVLKYRTRPAEISSKEAWKNYQRAVLADARQAIRVLRGEAKELGVDPQKIGICGFSAGGYLAINCALRVESKPAGGRPSGMPDFAGLFYPGIPDDVEQLLASRQTPNSAAGPICPLFIVNARSDKLTPASRCVDFYARLLEAGVNAELHVFGKGAHGFDLGIGRGQSVAFWPRLFVAWLEDLGLMQ